MITAYVPRPNVAENNPVEHPAHYTYGQIETIDFIEDKGLNFNRGNAVKYIIRAGHKDDEVQDLMKAKWYIEREIARIQKGSNG